MPFSATKSHSKEEWDDIFRSVFASAIEESDYSCKRSEIHTGSLIRSIIDKLRNSKIVLADLTDQNPNVFYELGVRHSLSKRTIMVAQKMDDVPSDLRSHWTLIYGTKPGEVIQFKREIKRLILEIEKNPEYCDNPVSDYLESEHIGISNFVAKENTRKLGALSTELSANLNTLKKIENNQNYKDYLNTDCLSLLLNTMYVDPGGKMLANCYQLRHNLAGIKFGHRLDHGFLKLNIDLTKQVKESILEIRRRITLGEYIEPVKISTVEWELITQSSKTSNKTTKIEDSINPFYSTIKTVKDEKAKETENTKKNRVKNKN
jgi:hypothetical protein